MIDPAIAVVEVRNGKLSALGDFYDVASDQQAPSPIDNTLDAHRSRIGAE